VRDVKKGILVSLLIFLSFYKTNLAAYKAGKKTAIKLGINMHVMVLVNTTLN